MARVKIGNIMGPQGIQGIQGPVGSQGPKGDQGVQGQTGSQGPKGATGATGSQGPKGDQGVKGTTGAQGPQGSQGIQGPIGPVGPQGPLPPLVANYLATAAGQGALDAYMGKLIDQRLTDLMNKFTQLNGDLGYTEIRFSPNVENSMYVIPDSLVLGRNRIPVLHSFDNTWDFNYIVAWREKDGWCIRTSCIQFYTFRFYKIPVKVL